MATRLKTVEYWFNGPATMADAVATNATQITVYLPESSITFRSVVADVIVMDANTTLANITQRQIEIRLGAVAYSAVNNTNTLAHGGENFAHMFSGDFTSYFTTNWTGTSMTADARVTINTGTAGSVNASIRLTITYAFDDTSATHVKTVRIPLDAPASALATSKPGTATATIPDLSTYCPENSKTFRQMSIVVQANTEGNGATDKSISWEIDSDGAFTSQLYELGTTVDITMRLNQVVSFTTNATHSFYIWASATDWDHPQAWLVVTYEFTTSGTTQILNSLLLPMEVNSPMGGTTSSDYQRSTRDVWIEEPGTITTLGIAYYVHWDKATAISGLNMRVGTGSFVAYTDVATVVAGSACAMVRNDAAFTFARGRNSINFDIYRTETSDIGYNVSGFWLINYTSDVPSQGIWAANHTVVWTGANAVGTMVGSVERIYTAFAPVIPEADYFLTSIGACQTFTSQTGANSGSVTQVERLASGEGGMVWESVYADIGGSDPETGVHWCYSTARDVFKRWASEPDTNRLDLETARRWKTAQAAVSGVFTQLDVLFTYHTITFAIAGDVTGSSGGTVTLVAHRESNGEILATTTRVGDGAYSMTWYDDTEDVFVEARESSTLLGRSDNSTAA